MLQGKPYDENVNSGCQLVTPENMYSSEIEKLIFPFNTIKQTFVAVLYLHSCTFLQKSYPIYAVPDLFNILCQIK
mgnify:CR=1 FL=1